jgi:hypothetical protein
MANSISSVTTGTGGIVLESVDTSGNTNIKSGTTTIVAVTSTGAAVTGTLSSTGNTTLGDASTDTLNVGNGDLVKDASGNVGVGVTPTTWSQGKVIELGTSGVGLWQIDSGSFATIQNTYYNTGWKYASTAPATYYVQTSGQHQWFNAPSGTINTPATFTQAMTLDTSGNLLVGTTSQPGAGALTTGCEFFSGGAVLVNRTAATPCYFGRTNDGEIMALYSGTTQRGVVSISGATTTYGSISDYRLKENVGGITDGLAKVMTLKPSTFNFIEFPNKTVNGFIAHEVAEVEPIAVTGEKDYIDEDGKPVYQSIDPAKLVPLLTAAIQEQQALITSLTARLDTQAEQIKALQGAK